jgi:hypothetical protein
MAPRLLRVPGAASVRYWQALNADYGRAMPRLLLTRLAFLVATCVLSWRRGGLTLGLALAGTTLVVVTIVPTLVWLEPLNPMADGWDPDRLPSDWSDTRSTWARGTWCAPSRPWWRSAARSPPN